MPVDAVSVFYHGHTRKILTNDLFRFTGSPFAFVAKNWIGRTIDPAPAMTTRRAVVAIILTIAVSSAQTERAGSSGEFRHQANEIGVMVAAENTLTYQSKHVYKHAKIIK